jgi:hypothetical protein
MECIHMLNPKYSPKNVVFSLYNLEEGYAPIIADPKNLKPFVHFLSAIRILFYGFSALARLCDLARKVSRFFADLAEKVSRVFADLADKVSRVFADLAKKKSRVFWKTIETSVAKSEMISEIPRKTIDVWDPPTKSQILTGFLKNHRRFLGLQRYPIRSDILTLTWDLIGLARYSPNHHGFSGNP